jgi:hypothetical protein
MANYAYELSQAPARRAAYLGRGTIEAAPGVLQLVRGGFL